MRHAAHREIWFVKKGRHCYRDWSHWILTVYNSYEIPDNYLINRHLILLYLAEQKRIGRRTKWVRIIRKLNHIFINLNCYNRDHVPTYFTNTSRFSSYRFHRDLLQYRLLHQQGNQRNVGGNAHSDIRTDTCSQPLRHNRNNAGYGLVSVKTWSRAACDQYFQ